MMSTKANSSSRQQRLSAPTAKLTARRRLAPEERAEMILENAIRFFAEHGFDGQLKDLAEIIGVSQALIFSYFGSKQILIERVYERVYIARWKSSWHDILVDRTKPLDQRLIEYYKDYLAAIDDPIWIRIVLYSGLGGNDLTRRYVSGRVEKLLRTIVSEAFVAFRFSKSQYPENDLYEAVWNLQSSFMWGLVRKHVWKVPVMSDTDHLIELRVSNFLAALQGHDLSPVTAGSPARRVSAKSTKLDKRSS